MNLDMVKPGKFGRFHLVYQFTVPLKNLSTFKNQIKKWIPKDCPCRLYNPHKKINRCLTDIDRCLTNISRF